MGAWLNPGWDSELAERRISQLGLDLRQRAGSLSGGQRAQLALTLATAKRPELLLLDEPVASLDPLARREFLQDLMETVAEQQVSVVLSSHLIADIERVCDYLIVLTASRVRLAGETEALLATHHRLSGPRRDPRTLPASWEVIEESHAGKQSTLLVRTYEPVLDPAWTVRPVSLEDLVLAYMSQPGDAARAGLARIGDRIMIRFAWTPVPHPGRGGRRRAGHRRRRPAGDRDPARPRLRRRRRRLQAARQLRGPCSTPSPRTATSRRATDWRPSASPSPA